MSTLSKDQIKDRLLKRAAKYWGYSDVELENVFDPIVNLLFDVCANELEKISNEIYTSRRRVTERLIEILTPSISTKAIPSRAIMKAYPIENEVTLSNFHQFFYQKRENNLANPVENNYKNYFFGPTLPIKLSRNQIRYVVYPNGLYEEVNDQYKELCSSSKFIKPLPHSSIWFAINHEGDNVLQDFMLYFYYKKIENKELFYHFLPKTNWYINNKKIATKKGYNTTDSFYSQKEIDLTNTNYYHLEKIEQQVNSFYENHFITITDSITITEECYTIPQELVESIPEEEIKKLEVEKNIWIRVDFSNVINNDFLNNLYCSCNCFPVTNKKINVSHSPIKDTLNIFPLQLDPDESFLELLNVTDDKNNEFDIVNTNQNQEDEESNFVYLRYGGIARFDERNATQEIHYLIDLIRDEASAFSRLGADFTANNLKEINQIIARFRNKINEIGDVNNTKPYLVLESDNNSQGNILFTRFWSTLGMGGNKINAFSRVNLYKGTDFETNSMLLLTTSIGGRDELANTDKIYAYRENLISNQRIVTRQDIIILCKKHFGNAVTEVSIKNGVQNSLESTIGYTPTIDIYLTKNISINYSIDEWEFLKDDLKLKIEARAVNVVPYRIFFV